MTGSRGASSPEEACEAIKASLCRVARRPDWLIGQWLLYRADDGSLSLFSLVVPPGSETPIHDHLAWGLVGLYRGAQDEEIYAEGNRRIPRWAELCVAQTVLDERLLRGGAEDRMTVAHDSARIMRTMERLSQPDAAAALAWLDARRDDLSTGYDATGWEATIWIVHAMYETDDLPGGITHDDVYQIERAAGLREPEIPQIEKLLEGATVIGSTVGASAWPGRGWRRLWWSELAGRLSVDPYALDTPPCDRSFPYSSWPANISPPAEGSLDREQFVHLLDHLAEASGDGNETACFSYHSPFASGNLDEHTVYRCKLRDLMRLYDHEEGSPSNLWSEERSWFVYSDWDLWATKVSGSKQAHRRHH